MKTQRLLTFSLFLFTANCCLQANITKFIPEHRYDKGLTFPQATLDLDSVEHFTKKTFAQLIIDKGKINEPFILAVVRNGLPDQYYDVSAFHAQCTQKHEIPTYEEHGYVRYFAFNNDQFEYLGSNDLNNFDFKYVRNMCLAYQPYDSALRAQAHYNLGVYHRTQKRVAPLPLADICRHFNNAIMQKADPLVAIRAYVELSELAETEEDATRYLNLAVKIWPKDQEQPKRTHLTLPHTPAWAIGGGILGVLLSRKIPYVGEVLSLLGALYAAQALKAQSLPKQVSNKNLKRIASLLAKAVTGMGSYAILRFLLVSENSGTLRQLVSANGPRGNR